jgi:hypothetical protein
MEAFHSRRRCGAAAQAVRCEQCGRPDEEIAVAIDAPNGTACEGCADLQRELLAVRRR